MSNLTPPPSTSLSIPHAKSLLREAEKERARRLAQTSFLEYVRFINTDWTAETPKCEIQIARHQYVLAEKLQGVVDGKIPRLMIFMPPGHGKSTWASIWFPSYWLGVMGKERIVAASHTKELAEHFGRQVRSLVNLDEYKSIFGIGLSEEVAAAGQWQTSVGGEYFGVGINGNVTGRRLLLGLVDDPIKGHEAADSETEREKLWLWWLTEMHNRRLPYSSFVVIQTRWHEDDFSGRQLDMMAKGGDKWEVVEFPAEATDNDILGRKPGEWLWPEFFPPEHYELEKKIQIPRFWSALYQQRPTPETGDYFKEEWFRWYDEEPKGLRFYGASDYAVSDSKGDWTVHGIFGVDPDDNIFVIDWWRERTESDVWVDTLIDLMDTYKTLKWAEEKGQIEKGVGPFIRKRQKERKVWALRQAYNSARDKAIRARSIQGRMAMGKVYFPRMAPWSKGLVDELLRFPHGTHDDQVDVMSLIGRMLDRLVPGREPKRVEEKAKGMTFDELLASQSKPNRERRERRI